MNTETKTYRMRVLSDPDNDIQPTVEALESPMVATVTGLDTDRVEVVLVAGADAAAYELLMDADPGVVAYCEVA